MLVSKEHLLWCPRDDMSAAKRCLDDGVDMSQLQGAIVAAAVKGAVTCIECQPMKR